MLVFVYCLFVFQVGLRWQTGTDWEPYLVHFEETNSVWDVYYSLTGFEQGYAFMVLIVKNLWNNYSVFLVIHAILYYILVFTAFKKFTPYIFISLMVFYVTTMAYMGSNRQLLALAICLFSLRYVIDRKALKFFICIGIAFMFHRTALLFCVYYFLYRDIKPSILLGVLAISVVLGKTSFPSTMFSFVGDYFGGMATSKVSLYLDRSEGDLSQNQLSILGFVKRLLFLGLFLFNYKRLTKQLNYYKLIFNGYYVGLVFYFLFSSTLLIMVNRGSMYFNIMESLLIASQFLLLRNKHYRVEALILVFVMSIFLLFQSISGYSDLFLPYKGLFINEDFHRYRLG
jgi:hypothetical protein